MARIVAIVQARMGSSRLPGKSLADIAGKPMLQHVVERLARSRRIDEVVIATTTDPRDTPVLRLAETLCCRAFAGSEQDVLTRYLEAGSASRADVIVRVTADCPLIDPVLPDEVIDAYLREGADYASNILVQTYPRGVETEVFSLEALRGINGAAAQPFEREHVTPYFYLHPEEFKLVRVTAEGTLRRPDLRLCVDTEADLRLVRELFARLGKEDNHFSLADVIQAIAAEPHLAAINAHVAQKQLGE